jgi:hypothetical protein
MSEPEGFATPELAALSGWRATPRARPRVAHVEIRGERAEVVVELENGCVEWVYCERDPDGWSESDSGNAPNIGWDGPRQGPR